MKNKGFTLVELLAIVILLVGIFMLTYPKLTEMFERESKKLDDYELDTIYDAVDRYLDNNDEYPLTVGIEYCIKIETLDYEGLIPDFDDKDYLSKAIRVKIGKSSNYHQIIDQCSKNDSNTEDNGDSPINSGTNSSANPKPKYGSIDNSNIIINNTEQKNVSGIIYLDPKNITAACYSSNSNIGSGTSGCMRWYIYAETDSDYSLILDHNIGSSSWGTTYSCIPTTSTSYCSPTIRPSTYENSVVKRYINNLGWNSELNTSILSYEVAMQLNSASQKNLYEWLYNNASNGYWIMPTCRQIINTSSGYYQCDIRIINSNGKIQSISSSSANINYGIRPVIKVEKQS